MTRLHVRECCLACGVSLAVLAGATPALAQGAGYSVSVSTAQASYPDQRLRGVFIFNSLDLAIGRIRLAASVPLMRQSNTTDIPDLATGTVVRNTETSGGFGDPLVRIDVRIQDTPDFQVSAAGAFKPSLVSAESGRGTGAADVGFGVSLFRSAGRTSVLADAVFWHYGEPEGVAFSDGLSYSVGVGRAIGRGRWSALVSLSGFSSGIAGSGAPVHLNVAALALAGRARSISVSAGVGLNEAAGDFSFGVSWRTAFR